MNLGKDIKKDGDNADDNGFVDSSTSNDDEKKDHEDGCDGKEKKQRLM